MLLKKKPFIKNKNLIWLQIRKNSRINLKFKIYKQFRPLNNTEEEFCARKKAEEERPSLILNALKYKISFKYFYFLLQYLIKKGKKYSLEVLFKKSLINWIHNHSIKNFNIVLDSAFKNIIPHVGVITKRKGSKNIYIPYRLPKKKQIFLATKWILLTALAKKKRKFYDGILEELIDCSSKISISIKKKEDLLKLAEENVHNLKKRR